MRNEFTDVGVILTENRIDRRRRCYSKRNLRTRGLIVEAEGTATYGDEGKEKSLKEQWRKWEKNKRK